MTMNINEIIKNEINKKINEIANIDEARASLAHKDARKRTKDDERNISDIFKYRKKIFKLHHKGKKDYHKYDDIGKKSSHKKKHKKSTSAEIEAKKIKNRDGNNISTGDESQIRNDVTHDDIINIAALARKVYPDHTPEGAQSQLRKKLKALKNDNGSEYHLKSREASIIRKELGKI